MVERGGLENRCTLRYRGFESLALCNQAKPGPDVSGPGFFVPFRLELAQKRNGAKKNMAK